MAKAEKAQKATFDIGHNSQRFHPTIIAYFEAKVEADVQRRAINKMMADEREVAKEAGLDTKALDAVYAYYKQKKNDRDGYDETETIAFEALNNAETGDLFSALYTPKED